MIDQNIFVAQTVNFIILIGVLYYFLYKPVRNFMDQRTAEIEGQIKSAEENQRVAEELRIELEKQAQESKQRARQFLDEATKRAEHLQAELTAKAHKEAQEIIENAKKVAKMEQEKAWADLKGQVGELALLLASKVVQESLDSTQHQVLIDQTMDQLDSLTGEQIQ